MYGFLWSFLQGKDLRPGYPLATFLFFCPFLAPQILCTRQGGAQEVTLLKASPPVDKLILGRGLNLPKRANYSTMQLLVKPI
jgi:hypothetical protein